MRPRCNASTPAPSRKARASSASGRSVGPGRPGVRGGGGAAFRLRVWPWGGRGPPGSGAGRRPPADIPRGSAPPRWPIRPTEPPPYQSRVLPDYQVGSPQPRRDIAPDEPVSLNPPGVADQPGVAAEPYDFRRPYGVTPAAPPPKYRAPPPVASPRDDFSPEPYERRPPG